MSVLELLVWGFLLHSAGDWIFQNEWMAVNKAKLRREPQGAPDPYVKGWESYDTGGRSQEIVIPKDDPGSPWWDRHPAAYVHAGIHTLLMVIIFPVWAALLIGALHLIVDTRTPLTKWKERFKQSIDPQAKIQLYFNVTDDGRMYPRQTGTIVPGDNYVPYTGMGAHVAVWQDQVVHAFVIAGVALLVGSDATWPF